MGNLIINIIGVFILIGIGYYLYFKLHPHAFDKMLEKQLKKNTALLTKDDSKLYGKRFTIKRDDGSVIKMNLYIPSASDNEKLPAVVIAHGGSFMDGSADQIDTLCNRLKENWGAVIVNIDYTLLTEKQFPYQHDEIKDTVLWFAKHASDFNIDPQKIVLAGFTAGAYLMVGAAALLRDFKFTPAGVILCYPILDDTMIRMADAGIHPSPLGIISCGHDQMAERMTVYREHMDRAGIDYELQNYSDAYTGFIEANNPEYTENPKLNRNPAVSEDQENMARAAEMWMGGQLERFFEKSEKHA